LPIDDAPPAGELRQTLDQQGQRRTRAEAIRRLPPPGAAGRERVGRPSIARCCARGLTSAAGRGMGTKNAASGKGWWRLTLGVGGR
jgi:hypothetical protein